MPRLAFVALVAVYERAVEAALQPRVLVVYARALEVLERELLAGDDDLGARPVFFSLLQVASLMLSARPVLGHLPAP